MKKSISNRFWSKVNKNGSAPLHYPALGQCWEWTGSKIPGGYGTLRISRELGAKLAHRISYLLNIGDIAHNESYHGICVLHKCDNPGCVNPEHLFLGTNQDNMDDMVIKNRQNKAKGYANGMLTRPERRPRGELHGLAKFTEEDVLYIRSSSLSRVDLSKKFNVNKSTIERIINRKTWKHINKSKS
jgi:hypothetical protein